MSKLIIANWKSNKTVTDVRSWFDLFLKSDVLSSSRSNQTEVVIAPPFTLLSLVDDFINQDRCCNLAVQDLSSYPAGSYTGAISVVNLEDFKVKYAIIGHSERRRWFHETDNDIALKVEQALANNITPIVCVDESNFISQASKLDQKVWNQCVLAYEPKDAIGTGMGQDVSLVEATLKKIKQEFNPAKALYGGSVNELNVNEYLSVADGVLIGSVSLDAHKFSNLIKAAQNPPRLA